MKKDRIATIVSNDKIANDIYMMKIAFDDFEDVICGQFIHIQLPAKEHVLRRPFCICDFDKEKRTIDVCYAIVGDGTKILSEQKEGCKISCMFPLGNGFIPTKQMKKILLVGGGMGCAVLPAIPTSFPNREYHTFLGFCDKDKVILEKQMKEKSTSFTLATDNGSCGIKGFITNAVAEQISKISPDVVFCCGPEIMYKALAKCLACYDVPIIVSLEERMGCGIGACLVCNCKIKKNGKEEYLRVCKDGPVFYLNEVVL